MNSANRGGHNYQAQGAGGYVNEVVEDRKINSSTINHLRTLGHSANDVTPGNCDATTDLIYGVQIANNMGVDVFNSNHLNACYTTDKAMGCECVTYGDAPSEEIADRITNNLVKLGFKRRPNKINKELYEVRATVMPSIIVEPFFVDSYADVQLYYKVGADEIGRAIAYGLANKEFNIIKEEPIKPKVEEELFMLFSEKFYLGNNPDVAAAVKAGAFKNGKDHYLQSGRSQGRKTIPQLPLGFTEGIYLKGSVDVANAIKKGSFQNGAEHYLIWGFAEKRIYALPNDWEEDRYLKLNIGLKETLKNLTAEDHYIMYGFYEGRKYL